MSNKFSASVHRRQAADGANSTPKKTDTFDHETEDKIRVQSRKLTYLVSDLKEEKIIPLTFGLMYTNDKLKKFFEIE